MNFYIIHDTEGHIVSCGTTPEIMDQRLSEDHTQVWTPFPSDIENYRFDISSNSIVPLKQSVIDARETQESWVLFRDLRNTRLSASDWTQVPDAPVDQTAWATYRQALRDLPATTEDPANPVWPIPPS